MNVFSKTPCAKSKYRLQWWPSIKPSDRKPSPQAFAAIACDGRILSCGKLAIMRVVESSPHRELRSLRSNARIQSIRQVTARQGNLQVLSRLFAKSANVTSCLMAFPYIFTSGADEQAMLSRIGLFVEYIEHEVTRPYDHPAIPDAIVFLSVRQYPKIPSVLKAILNSGLAVDQKMCHGYNAKPEHMTCLFWASL